MSFCDIVLKMLEDAGSGEPGHLERVEKHMTECEECKAALEEAEKRPGRPAARDHLTPEELEKLLDAPRAGMGQSLREMWLHVAGCWDCRQDLQILRALHAPDQPGDADPLLDVEEVRALWRQQQRQQVLKVVLVAAGIRLLELAQSRRRPGVARRAAGGELLRLEEERQMGPYRVQFTLFLVEQGDERLCRTVLRLLEPAQGEEDLRVSMTRAGTAETLAEVAFRGAEASLPPAPAGSYSLEIRKGGETAGSLELQISSGED